MPRVALAPKVTRMGFTFVPLEMRERLEARAKANYRTLSQEIRMIVEQSLNKEDEAKAQGQALAQ